jgi:hypothetical protein
MVKQNLSFCLEKINAAAQKCGRDPRTIVWVAVTKGVALPHIQEAIENGVAHIGENRVQEALLKYGGLQEYAKGKGVKLFWHMVGHLQSNKAKDAVKIFDLIHSVDSVVLAAEIDRQALKIGKIQDILLQVNVSREATKFGFSVESVTGAFCELAALKNISIKGLMTIAPEVDDPEAVRPVFRKLKELSREVFVHRPSSIVHRPILSMGMTDDFQVAVEEGADLVRIGRGIFEAR